jgi:hypothetical protein
MDDGVPPNISRRGTTASKIVRLSQTALSRALYNDWLPGESRDSLLGPDYASTDTLSTGRS